MATELETDVARVGTFRDMAGKVVEISKRVLQDLAESLNLSVFRPKIKLGHVNPRTEDPSWGDVVGLRVEGDRLIARLRPTPALHQKMRDGEYTERSIEFTFENGRAKFLGLAMLGLRTPAVSALAPLALASLGGSIFLMSSAPDEDDEESPCPPGVEPLSFFAARAAERRSRSAGISFSAAVHQLADEKDETVSQYLLTL